MGTLLEIASELQTYADKLRASGREFSLPEQEYSLDGAIKKLRAVLGADIYISIEMTIDSFSDDQSEPKVSWQIYDGKSHQKANSLAGAVNKVLAVHLAPKDGDSLAEAQKLIDEAVPAEL